MASRRLIPPTESKPSREYLSVARPLLFTVKLYQPAGCDHKSGCYHC